MQYKIIVNTLWNSSVMKPKFTPFASPFAKPSKTTQAPKNTGTALRLGDLSDASANWSPAQKRFNTLVARIDKLKVQIGDIQVLADAHRVVYQATIPPLRKSNEAALKKLTLFLDERLQRGGLPEPELSQGMVILLRICASFVERGDDEMRALFDKRSPQSYEALQQARMADTKKRMAAFFAANPDEFGIDDDMQPDDTEFEEALDDLQEAVQAEQARRQAAAGSRSGSEEAQNSRNTQTAAQKKQQLDASTVLRTVYRQLASALHPDRAQGAADQQRKTTLMSEVNAAYERQDLMALLHLQVSIEQASSQSLMQLPAEKMDAMNRLLKAQANELKQALLGHQIMLIREFNLSPYDKPTAESLRAELAHVKDELEMFEYGIGCDMNGMKRDPGLKRWIKRETKLAERQARG